MNFDKLFLAYHRQMLFVAQGILHNPSDAEDAVQNALLKIYRLRDSIPEDPRVRRAYVLTAAKYAALAGRLPSRFWEGEPAEGDDYPVEVLCPYGDEPLPFE